VDASNRTNVESGRQGNLNAESDQIIKSLLVVVAASVLVPAASLKGWLTGVAHKMDADNHDDGETHEIQNKQQSDAIIGDASLSDEELKRAQ